MSTKDDAYMTGHDYLVGVPALAARMDTDAKELICMLIPDNAHARSRRSMSKRYCLALSRTGMKQRERTLVTNVFSYFLLAS